MKNWDNYTMPDLDWIVARYVIIPFKNILNNSICDCGDVEDTIHYLLACEQYSDLKQDLIYLRTTTYKYL